LATLKKKKLSSSSLLEDEFWDWQDEPPMREGTETSDVTEYINTILDSKSTSICKDGELDLIKFWSDSTIKKQFLKLSRVARGIFKSPYIKC